MVSPKFAKKLTWVQNLDILKTYVPVTQISIPPELYEIDYKFPSPVSAPPPTTTTSPVYPHQHQQQQQPSSFSSSSPTNSRDAQPQQYQGGVRTKHFGAPLEVLMGADGSKGVPRVIRECIEFVRTYGTGRLLIYTPRSSFLTNDALSPTLRVGAFVTFS
jgi:Rho GTPase-activating protein 1